MTNPTKPVGVDRHQAVPTVGCTARSPQCSRTNEGKRPRVAGTGTRRAVLQTQIPHIHIALMDGINRSQTKGGWGAWDEGPKNLLSARYQSVNRGAIG